MRYYRSCKKIRCQDALFFYRKVLIKPPYLYLSKILSSKWNILMNIRYVRENKILAYEPYIVNRHRNRNFIRKSKIMPYQEYHKYIRLVCHVTLLLMVTRRSEKMCKYTFRCRQERFFSCRVSNSMHNFCFLYLLEVSKLSKHQKLFFCK